MSKILVIAGAALIILGLGIAPSKGALPALVVMLVGIIVLIRAIYLLRARPAAAQLDEEDGQANGASGEGDAASFFPEHSLDGPWAQSVIAHIRKRAKCPIEISRDDIIPNRNKKRFLSFLDYDDTGGFAPVCASDGDFLPIDVWIPELKLAFGINEGPWNNHSLYMRDKFGMMQASEERYKEEWCRNHGISFVNLWEDDDPTGTLGLIDSSIDRAKTPPLKRGLRIRRKR